MGHSVPTDPHTGSGLRADTNLVLRTRKDVTLAQILIDEQAMPVSAWLSPARSRS